MPMIEPLGGLPKQGFWSRARNALNQFGGYRNEEMADQPLTPIERLGIGLRGLGGGREDVFTQPYRTPPFIGEWDTSGQGVGSEITQAMGRTGVYDSPVPTVGEDMRRLAMRARNPVGQAIGRAYGGDRGNTNYWTRLTGGGF